MLTRVNDEVMALLDDNLGVAWLTEHMREVAHYLHLPPPPCGAN